MQCLELWLTGGVWRCLATIEVLCAQAAEMVSMADETGAKSANVGDRWQLSPASRRQSFFPDKALPRLAFHSPYVGADLEDTS